MSAVVSRVKEPSTQEDKGEQRPRPGYQIWRRLLGSNVLLQPPCSYDNAKCDPEGGHTLALARRVSRRPACPSSAFRQNANQLAPSNSC